MTVEDLLPRLDAVRRTSRGFQARCPVPAHADRHPSLSVSEGERGILLKCWSGCGLEEISAAIGLRVKDLFFDRALDPHVRRKVHEQRTRQREKQARVDEVMGFTIDALREADYFIRSRQGLDVSAWIDDKLDEELNALADAYQLLECEALYE